MGINTQKSPEALLDTSVVAQRIQAIQEPVRSRTEKIVDAVDGVGNFVRAVGDITTAVGRNTVKVLAAPFQAIAGTAGQIVGSIEDGGREFEKGRFRNGKPPEPTNN